MADGDVQLAVRNLFVNVLHRLAARPLLPARPARRRLCHLVRQRGTTRPLRVPWFLTPSSRLCCQSARYYINGFMGGLAVLLEHKSRRIELAMYCAPRALESLWNSLAKRGLVRNVAYVLKGVGPRGPVSATSSSRLGC